MKYLLIITVSIVAISCANIDPDPQLDEDWIAFKSENRKDYKNNRAEEALRFYELSFLIYSQNLHF
jgi:hypothetical protein